MKVSVAIALIVCGTVLIIVPYVSHSISMSRVVDMSTQLSKPVSFKSGLPRSYDKNCMISGLAMILTGTISSFVKQKKELIAG
jgi:uncharacterized membrane protein